MDELSLKITSLSVVLVKEVEGSAFGNPVVVVAAEVDMSGTVMVGGTEVVSRVVLVTISPAVLAPSLVSTSASIVVRAVAGIKTAVFCTRGEKSHLSYLQMPSYVFNLPIYKRRCMGRLKSHREKRIEHGRVIWKVRGCKECSVAKSQYYTCTYITNCIRRSFP